MASIRRLKKDLKNLVSDLISECETYMKFHPETDRKKTMKIIDDLENKSKALFYEINHYRDKGNVKTRDYYQKIVARVKKELLPLMDKIGDLEK